MTLEQDLRQFAERAKEQARQDLAEKKKRLPAKGQWLGYGVDGRARVRISGEIVFVKVTSNTSIPLNAEVYVDENGIVDAKEKKRPDEKKKKPKKENVSQKVQTKPKKKVFYRAGSKKKRAAGRIWLAYVENLTELPLTTEANGAVLTVGPCFGPSSPPLDVQVFSYEIPPNIVFPANHPKLPVSADPSGNEYNFNILIGGFVERIDTGGFGILSTEGLTVRALGVSSPIFALFNNTEGYEFSEIYYINPSGPKYTRINGLIQGICPGKLHTGFSRAVGFYPSKRFTVNCHAWDAPINDIPDQYSDANLPITRYARFTIPDDIPGWNPEDIVYAVEPAHKYDPFREEADRTKFVSYSGQDLHLNYVIKTFSRFSADDSLVIRYFTLNLKLDSFMRFEYRLAAATLNFPLNRVVVENPEFPMSADSTGDPLDETITFRFVGTSANDPTDPSPEPPVMGGNPAPQKDHDPEPIEELEVVQEFPQVIGPIESIIPLSIDDGESLIIGTSSSRITLELDPIEDPVVRRNYNIVPVFPEYSSLAIANALEVSILLNEQRKIIGLECIYDPEPTDLDFLDNGEILEITYSITGRGNGAPHIGNLEFLFDNQRRNIRGSFIRNAFSSDWRLTIPDTTPRSFDIPARDYDLREVNIDTSNGKFCDGYIEEFNLNKQIISNQELLQQIASEHAASLTDTLRFEYSQLDDEGLPIEGNAKELIFYRDLYEFNNSVFITFQGVSGVNDGNPGIPPEELLTWTEVTSLATNSYDPDNILEEENFEDKQVTESREFDIPLQLIDRRPGDKSGAVINISEVVFRRVLIENRIMPAGASYFSSIGQLINPLNFDLQKTKQIEDDPTSDDTGITCKYNEAIADISFLGPSLSMKIEFTIRGSISYDNPLTDEQLESIFLDPSNIIGTDKKWKPEQAPVETNKNDLSGKSWCFDEERSANTIAYLITGYG